MKININNLVVLTDKKINKLELSKNKKGHLLVNMRLTLRDLDYLQQGLVTEEAKELAKVLSEQFANATKTSKAW